MLWRGDNHRVSVFTTDGKFVSSFEGYDNKKDQLISPLWYYIRQ